MPPMISMYGTELVNFLKAAKGILTGDISQETWQMLSNSSHLIS